MNQVKLEESSSFENIHIYNVTRARGKLDIKELWLGLLFIFLLHSWTWFYILLNGLVLVPQWPCPNPSGLYFPQKTFQSWERLINWLCTKLADQIQIVNLISTLNVEKELLVFLVEPGVGLYIHGLLAEPRLHILQNRCRLLAIQYLVLKLMKLSFCYPFRGWGDVKICKY